MNYMMKALIIEDEQAIASALCKQLVRLRPDIDIVATTTSINSSRSAILLHPDLDLIISDIKIDDGLSFAVFDNIETNAMIVFSTAYDEYALKAFDFNCVDYLIKPVSDEAMNRALVRCERYRPTLSAALIQDTKEQILQNNVIFRKRILLKRGPDTIICDVNSILYILSENSITRVYMLDGIWGDSDISLTILSGELSGEQFFRLNRQAIVNLEYIGTISPGPGRDSTISLKTPFQNRKFVITQERKKALIKHIQC